LLITLVALVLAGCGGPARPVAPPSAPAAATLAAGATTAASETPTLVATTPVSPVTVSASTLVSATVTVPDWTQVANVEGDFYVLCNPQTPVRLVD
jgi:hypothetical protein